MQIESKRPEQWKTFNDRVMYPVDMDHQHLSNIYWYHRIFFDIKMIWAIDIIESKYNGQLLPYSPHVSFTQEIKMLEEKNMIEWYARRATDIQHIAVIRFEGNTIGHIRKPIR